MTRVDVWSLALQADPDADRAARDVLTPAERDAIDRYRDPHDRAARTHARALLRRALARVHGGDPGTFVIIETAAGRPVPADPAVPHFSLSHSRTLAAVAICTTRELGIDVERRRDFSWREVAERFFTPAELAAVEEKPDPLDAFFAIWVRKEAYLKGIGLGFTDGDAAVAVSLEDGFVPGTTWYLHGLDLVSDHAAALAVEGGPATVACRDARVDL